MSNQINLKKIAGSHLLNILGWSNKRKFVVFESDDWGSIRTSSTSSYNKMLSAGLVRESEPVARYDSLASETDLVNLFDVLASFKDYQGNHPIFTANCIMANPDFSKIRESGFKSYHYELFTDTLKRYPKHTKSFDIWNEGIRSNVFYPQFHGREHINVKRWMKLLSEGDHNFRKAFDFETYAIKPHSSYLKSQNIPAALDSDNQSEIKEKNDILKDGLRLFANKFNMTSHSFIAPNYIWDSEIESILFELGVKFIQSSRFQNRPKYNSESYSRKFHYTGQKNLNNQTFLVRNCYFEPSLSGTSDVVNNCLKSISNAFFWNTPAIISTHRFNYVGYIDPKNTLKNLPLIKQLIKEILKRWPDVEFITSPQLGNLISNEQ